MFRISLVTSTVLFFACTPHPHQDNMRALANQRAAECQQDPNKPMCKREHVSCAADKAEVWVGTESWCAYTYYDESHAPSSWDTVLGGEANANCYPFGAHLKSCHDTRCTDYIVTNAPKQHFEGCPQ